MNDLKSRRKTKRLTLRNMSETTGIPFTRYAAIEGEHEKPDFTEFLLIEAALNCEYPTIDGWDGLLTCSICRDRYTTNKSGICDSCRQQQWIDDNG